MLKGISTHLFAAERLSVELLKTVRNAGFDSVEIFALPPHFDYRNKQQISDLGSWLTEQGSLLNSIHTPFCVDYQAHPSCKQWLSVADPERIKRLAAVDEIRRCLEFTEKVSCPLAVVHMGAPDDACQLKHFDALYYSLEVLVPFALARGVKIALENIPNSLSSLAKMRQFIEEANLTGIGICFDSGHSQLQANPGSEIVAGGPWILTTHLHDNHGKEDDHLLPYEGTIQWPEVLGALDRISFTGCFLLELKAGIDGAAAIMKKASHVFEQFEASKETALDSR